MRITKWGIILTLKNVGSFLATWSFTGIKASQGEFFYALLIFILINTPTDLLIANHLSSEKK